MSSIAVAEKHLRDLQSLPTPVGRSARAERTTQLVRAVMTCQTARYEAAVVYSPSVDLEMAHAVQC